MKKYFTLIVCVAAVVFAGVAVAIASQPQVVWSPEYATGEEPCAPDKYGEMRINNETGAIELCRP